MDRKNHSIVWGHGANFKNMGEKQQNFHEKM